MDEWMNGWMDGWVGEILAGGYSCMEGFCRFMFERVYTCCADLDLHSNLFNLFVGGRHAHAHAHGSAYTHSHTHTHTHTYTHTDVHAHAHAHTGVDLTTSNEIQR